MRGCEKKKDDRFQVYDTYVVNNTSHHLQYPHLCSFAPSHPSHSKQLI